MGKDSKIGWTHHTFNPWWGCAKVSPACANCYAKDLDARYHKGDEHWGVDAPRRFMSDGYWKQPLKWNRLATEAGERHRVFCASMADVFERLHDDHPDVLRIEGARQQLWELISQTPHLDWLLLTKRPENFDSMLPVGWEEGEPWRDNVWLGVTAESQQQVVDRVPILLDTPAVVRFVSCEPLLTLVSLAPFLLSAPALDWVIAGAESGPGARLMDENWVRLLREQCQGAGVAFFYKQKIDGRKKIELPELDGEVWDQVPRC